MRGKLLALAGVSLFALSGTTGVATATHSDGNGPNKDKANGTGTLATGDRAHVNAQADPNDANPRGHAWFKLASGAEAKGNVVCMITFDGMPGANTFIGFRDRRTNAGFALFVNDGGEPGPSSGDSFAVGPASNPESCRIDSILTGGPIVEGNFVVHNAP